MVVRQMVSLLVMATLLGLGVNLFSPNRIDYIGKYRSLSSGGGPITPPSAAPGDPPFIGVDVAELEYSHDNAIFVDSREPEEFRCGTIPGSINIPFEHLPEENLGTYFDSCFSGADKNHLIIVFCSGEECDLSLHLGRNLNSFGYRNVFVFFGGSREWEKFDLEIERRVDCGE